MNTLGASNGRAKGFSIWRCIAKTKRNLWFGRHTETQSGHLRSRCRGDDFAETDIRRSDRVERHDDHGETTIPSYSTRVVPAVGRDPAGVTLELFKLECQGEGK